MYKPTLEEAKEMSTKGNFIPIFAQIPTTNQTPVGVFEKVAYSQAGKRLPYAYLLESMEYGQKESAYSFIGINPIATFKQNDNDITITWGKNTKKFQSRENCFQLIEKELQQYKQVKVEELAPFNGGAVGYASFEQITQIEPKIKPKRNSPIQVPDAFFVINDTVIAFDHKKDVIQIISHINLIDEQDIEIAYPKATAKICKILEKIKKPSVSIPALMPKKQPVKYTSNTSKEEFIQMVKKAKQYIYDGDVIQVVLSQRMQVDLDREPIEIHWALRQINPSPYMFCLHYEEDFALVGCSPELHASCLDNTITMHPIAGTRPRGATPQKDKELEIDLLSDPKECAEHIMLVDLARNDLGKICKFGSVKVEKLMSIEHFSHVMHIVSDVKGKLRNDTLPSKTISETFPAGTVSGAPKVRAMEIITELEKEARGPYSGTVAYFSFNGNIDSCITIRTVVLKNNKIFIQAGAGIVADSDPEVEYNETKIKAASILATLEKTPRWIEKK